MPNIDDFMIRIIANLVSGRIHCKEMLIHVPAFFSLTSFMRALIFFLSSKSSVFVNYKTEVWQLWLCRHQNSLKRVRVIQKTPTSLCLKFYLPPANEVAEANVFTRICLFTEGGSAFLQCHGTRRHGSHFSGLAKFPDFSSIFSHFSSIFFLMFCISNWKLDLCWQIIPS